MHSRRQSALLKLQAYWKEIVEILSYFGQFIQVFFTKEHLRAQYMHTFRQQSTMKTKTYDTFGNVGQPSCKPQQHYEHPPLQEVVAERKAETLWPGVKQKCGAQ